LFGLIFLRYWRLCLPQVVNLLVVLHLLNVTLSPYETIVRLHMSLSDIDMIVMLLACVPIMTLAIRWRVTLLYSD